MARVSSLAPFGLQGLPTEIEPPITSNSVVRFDPETVKEDALSTRIVVHSRFPRLVQRFLEHKRLHGSSLEKVFYHAGWTWQQQIARLVQKRALVFMGRNDFTVLQSGEHINSAYVEWDRVGTEEESRNTHLFLKDYLSYDEIMLSSLIGVSGSSFFVNDGRRNNIGRPGKAGSFEPRGVIVGLVGARFERDDRMDSVFVLRDAHSPRQHPELRDIFFDFFGCEKDSAAAFDEDMYKARIRISADILFLEASQRAKAAGKKAYVYVVGLGLGVWAWHGSRNQSRLYVQAFIESLENLGDNLSHIGTVEFAWIDEVLGFKQRFMAFGASQTAIDVRFSRRNPAEKLGGADGNHLLVLSYAWDGNAFPGNEYWVGSLAATGDPAAACMSTISELHNPMVNPGFLDRIEILDRTLVASSEQI
ncbi:hypothetical protein E0Z10_g5981 [Xylaria hypoxylon]|uniref:Uncharacterized protein n=1 Tax=Xylaria hypoxylon TaxID=37992 RepID=A0A4Z0Z2I9_9PEZI|nr:hypothetical protein E0Z10_g5981 [Xylaria hypoxylon]